jgi:hypothetical protein
MEPLSDIFATMAGVPGLAILVLGGLAVFLTSDWRLSLAALLAEYIALGLVLSRFVQPAEAIAKILTGVFVVAILYLTAQRVQDMQAPLQAPVKRSGFLGLPLGWGAGPLGLPLRLLAVLLTLLGLVRLFGTYRFALVPIDIAFVACWLGSMGMLGLILSGDVLRVAEALLTVLVGFDLVYTSLEPDVAVAGLLAALILLAALAFSYLITVQGLVQATEMEEEEVEG